MRDAASHGLCVAPIMGWTDRHERAFLRMLTRHTRLYTEMITAAAMVHGDGERLAARAPGESPAALQLGGSTPDELAEAARLGAALGYDEINLNVGCPSDRVRSGRFGACLMAEPDLVARCVAAMIEATDVPVTVKCRIGIDDQDPETVLPAFIDTVAAAGVKTFIVHARKAWLAGLSPKENREIPPLDYDLVCRVKAARPSLRIVLNGGLATLDEALAASSGLDGAMLGRAAYHRPYLLAEADARVFGDPAPRPTRGEAVLRFMDYMAGELAAGTPLHAMTRHMFGLYHGQPRARAWRRILTEGAQRPGAGLEVVRNALALVEGDETAASRSAA